MVVFHGLSQTPEGIKLVRDLIPDLHHFYHGPGYGIASIPYTLPESVEYTYVTMGIASKKTYSYCFHGHREPCTCRWQSELSSIEWCVDFFNVG